MNPEPSPEAVPGSSRDTPLLARPVAAPDPARRPLGMADLQARRRRARRRRRIARLDVALGVVVAVTLLIASPGLAITAIVALLTLVVCLLSLVVGRRLRRRRGM